MRFSIYLAAALSFAAAAAADEYQGQPMPAGGLLLDAPGYTLQTPGAGWVLRTPVAPLRSGLRVQNGLGSWFFQHGASGGELFVQALRWDSGRWGDLGAYVRSLAAEGGASQRVTLTSTVLNGARCAGYRVATGTAWSLHRQICLHPEQPGFAVEMQFRPGLGDVEREGFAVLNSLRFTPIGYRVRELHPSCDVRGVAQAAGSLWISCSDTSAGAPGKGSVVRVDPVTGGVLARIAVDPQPGRIAAALGMLWVPSFDRSTLTRIDPRTNTVTAVVKLPAPAQTIVAAGGALWVSWATAEPRRAGFLRIDPASGVVTQRVPLDAPAGAVTATEHGIYFLQMRGDRLMRLDPATGAVTSPLAPGAGAALMHDDGRTLWLSGTDAEGPYLARVDPAKPEAAPVITRRVPERAVDFADWKGTSCILASQSVLCLAPGALREIPLASSRPTHLHIIAGALWVEDEDSTSVLRIDMK
jgi:hypothetical protein